MLVHAVSNGLTMLDWNIDSFKHSALAQAFGILARTRSCKMVVCISDD